jgi:alkaline phosphatase D
MCTDYGVNDGGKQVARKDERKSNYLKFLDFDQKKEKFDDIRTHEGIYYSRILRDTVSNISIKVIFLDTRSFRDSHYIRSIGEVHLPYTALGAAFIRLASSSFALGRGYAGDMLGPQQWAWLESELSDRAADINILVSSIQVATTNPILESWGHFPLAKRRLYDLLAATDPSGLILLSGDVHYAEISQIPFHRADGSHGKWLEFTSSGLTHTCADNCLTRYICPAMLEWYTDHRTLDGAATLSNYFIARNFGVINISQDLSGRHRAIINISLESIHELGNISLSRQLFVPIADEGQGRSASSRIVRVDVIPFPTLPEEIILRSLVALIILAVTLIYNLKERYRGENHEG